RAGRCGMAVSLGGDTPAYRIVRFAASNALSMQPVKWPKSSLGAVSSRAETARSLFPPELAVKVGLPNAKRNRRGPFDDRLANEGSVPWPFWANPSATARRLNRGDFECPLTCMMHL
ncbi:hypothetical protein J4G37_45740, partial [Microvirga sp. 3-52]|nr:hypothetical protein [Microvirga sp. 3-52]